MILSNPSSSRDGDVTSTQQQFFSNKLKKELFVEKKRSGDDNGKIINEDDNITESSSTASIDHRHDDAPKAKKSHLWHDFVAGAVAGGGARITTHPLDLIRTRRQLSSHFLHNHGQQNPPSSRSPGLLESMVQVVRTEGGFPALFRGNIPGVVMWMSYSSVQFSLYRHFKEAIPSLADSNSNADGRINPMIVTFGAGAAAGVGATLATYPLDLCRTIFAARGIITNVSGEHQQHQHWSGGGRKTAAVAADPPRTYSEFVERLYRRTGFRGFYAGCTPAILQIIPYMGLSFSIYEALTTSNIITTSRNKKGEDDAISKKISSSVGKSGTAGSIAGAISKAVVYPMDTVKKRMQAQAFFLSSNTPSITLTRYRGVADCIVTVVREEGFIALYRGLWPSVLKTSLSSGISFGLYRFVSNVLISIDPVHG